MFYRGYDPAIGRMLQVDPYTTMYASHTTYNYAVNNPVTMNNPSGGYVYANAAADRINKINDRNNPNYFNDWAESFGSQTNQGNWIFNLVSYARGGMVGQDAPVNSGFSHGHQRAFSLVILLLVLLAQVGKSMIL